jgi:hypothetical protein
MIQLTAPYRAARPEGDAAFLADRAHKPATTLRAPSRTSWVGRNRPWPGIMGPESAARQCCRSFAGSLRTKALGGEGWRQSWRRNACGISPKAGKIRQACLRQAHGVPQRGLYHALAQVSGFRLFDKQASKRADDLADAFMYAVLRCLGDGRAGRWDRLMRVA